MKLPKGVLFASALVSACAGPSTRYAVRESKPAGLVLGVKLATVAAPQLQGTPAGALSYEQIALPALLVQELRKTPGISDAMIVLGETPAVDAVLETSILTSNARMFVLDVKIRRMDGKVVRSDRFSKVASGQWMYKENQISMEYWGFYIWPLRLVLEPLVRSAVCPTDPWNPRHIVWPYGNWDKDDVKFITSPTAIEGADLNLISNVAKDAARVLRQYRYDPSEMRAAVYSGKQGNRPTPKMVGMATEAAQVERDQMWRPLTNSIQQRISATKQVYYAWKQEAWKFEERKDQAMAEKGSAEAMQFLGDLTSMAGGVMAGAAAAQGNIQLIAPSINLAAQGAVISAQGEADARVAQNKIVELNAALAKCSEPFNSAAGRQLTVRIYNKVYQLKGSKEEMLKELHRVVREQMAKGS